MMATIAPCEICSPPLSVPEAPAALPAAAEPDPEFASPVVPSCPPVYGYSVERGKDPVVVADMMADGFYVIPTGDML